MGFRARPPYLCVYLTWTRLFVTVNIHVLSIHIHCPYRCDPSRDESANWAQCRHRDDYWICPSQPPNRNDDVQDMGLYDRVPGT